MQQQAIALCLATGYVSAGTVEMLADDKQNFYFLEMNTRLQVEHAITELVSGEDLVEHMLWIAAGKPIPARLLVNKGCLDANGWAIESRVYAEDPLRNFLPSIGPLVAYKEPTLVPKGADSEFAVRMDTGVREGDAISMWYDPMISKLCTWGRDRDEAIAAMERALDEYFIKGVANNISFIRSILRNAVFRKGLYGTKFIGSEYPDGFRGVELTDQEEFRFVAISAALHLARQESRVRAPQSQYDAVSHGNLADDELLENRDLFVALSSPSRPDSPEQLFRVRTKLEEGVLDVDVSLVQDDVVLRVSYISALY